MANNRGSQQISLTTKRAPPTEPSPRAQHENSESVRSKLRESLAAALALVCHPDKQAGEGKSPQSEATSDPRQVNADPQQVESSSTIVDASGPIFEKPSETSTSSSAEFCKNHNEGQGSFHVNPINESKLDFTKMWTTDDEYQTRQIFPEDETSFIIKDDLLHGNGLCWQSDLDLDSFESRDLKRPKLLYEEVVPQNKMDNQTLCPQTVATEIEAELFKLFGGVNKKYKEKGRSLLFNLKDRNNPELRERVMSGGISPERLCSMTAEELASEELSQWRIAKAEEYAHMIVLQDSDVDLRRLVKKTHKGEFQVVEIDQDDSVSEEVAIGESSLAKIPFRSNEITTKKSDRINETEASEKTDSGGDNLITITHDNSDLMQGLMVDDELKDADFLPQIVSLDEFMDSLDSDPPFENLAEKAEHASSTTLKGDNAGSAGPMLDSSASGSKDPLDTSSQDKPAKMDVKYTKVGEIHKEPEIALTYGENEGEHVWDGVLQLNISSVVTVVGFFKSGEKTSTKEWPSTIEIKGRVRLDAFEKFLQELPLSRSRAIMVAQFCCKEGSPESDRLNLCEVVDSYVADERVGIAEPAPGVELYICPPHTKTVEMLCRLLPKDHTETFNTINNGLIGIVVWRRPHVTSTTSPKTSSHQSQNSRKQQFTLMKQQQEKHTNVRSVPPPPMDAPPSNPDPPPSDDDDVPPGFGPAAGSDEDDLPEFEFGKGPNPPSNKKQSFTMATTHPQAHPPTRQVDQMRELIQKYGQNDTSPDLVKWGRPGQGIEVESEPWNDDDDDIPEWQPLQDSKPQPPQPPPPLPPLLLPLPPSPLTPTPQPPMHHYQQPSLPPHAVAPAQPQPPILQPPLRMPLAPMPPQMGAMSGAHGTVHPGWQHVQWLPQSYNSSGASDAAGSPLPGNGLIRPCHLGGPKVENQFQGMPAQNGMDWRPRYS